LIGFLPTYQVVGIWAPIMLVILRLIQGFGAGAEIAGASVMLAEYAPRERRGIISSLVALGTNTGTLGAGAIWAIMLATMGTDTVVAWGWRIPFIASVVLMGLAVFIRLHLKESPVFEAATSGEILDDAA
ncbi:MFS transporter, partial [Actinotignum timonense]